MLDGSLASPLLPNPRQGPRLSTRLLGSQLLFLASFPSTVTLRILITYELERHLLLDDLRSPWEDGSSLGPPTSCSLGSLREPCSAKQHFSLARMKTPVRGNKVASVGPETRNGVLWARRCEFRPLRWESLGFPWTRGEVLASCKRQLGWQLSK